MMLLKPQNRIEDYLYIIVKKLNGEDINLNTLSPPRCRIEDYLYNIALNINSYQDGDSTITSNAITEIEVRKVEEGDTPSLTFTRENNKYLVDIVFPTSGTNFSGNAIDVFYKDNNKLGANNVQGAIDKLKEHTDKEIADIKITGGAMDYKYVDNAIKEVIDGAGEEFNTLGEIANILENNPNIISELRKQMVNILEDSNKYTDEKIATLNNIDIEIIAVLPPVGREDTLYFVVNAVGDSFLDLYLWDNINQDFDLVGSSTINLDGYAKLEDLPTKTSQLENDSNFAIIDDNKKSTDKTYSSNKIEELINAISNDILPRLSISNNRLYFDGQLIHLQGDTVTQADKVTGWQQAKPNSYLGVDKDGVYGWHTLPLTSPPQQGEYGGDKVTQLFLNKVTTNEVTEIPTVNPFNIAQCFTPFGAGVEGDKILFDFNNKSEISGNTESDDSEIIVRGSSTVVEYEFINDLGIIDDETQTSMFYSTDAIENPSDIISAELLNGLSGTIVDNKPCFNNKFQFKNIRTNAILTSNLTTMDIPTNLATYQHRVENSDGAGINIILDNTINVNAISVYVDTRYTCDPFIINYIDTIGKTRVLGTFVGNTNGVHHLHFQSVRGGRITIAKKGNQYAYFNRILVYGNDPNTDVLVVNQDNKIIDTKNNNNNNNIIEDKLTKELYEQYKITITTELFKTLPNNIKLVKYFYKTGDILTPPMTGETTVANGRTYVATASSNYGASYAPYKAFDQVQSNYWDSHLGSGHQRPSWVKIDLGQPEFISRYTYQGRVYSPSCMASYWKIEGSNDNTNWETIHETPAGSGNQTNGYVYESPILEIKKSYRYYRLSTMDSSMSYGLGVGELKFFGKAGYIPIPEQIKLSLTIPNQNKNNVEIIQEADLTSIANIMYINTIIYGDLDATKFQLSFDNKKTWKETQDSGMSWIDSTVGTPITELATINKTILDAHIQSDKKLFIKILIKNPLEDTVIDSITCKYQEERPYRQMADTTYYLDIYKSKIKITWRGNYEFVKIHFI